MSFFFKALAAFKVAVVAVGIGMSTCVLPVNAATADIYRVQTAVKGRAVVDRQAGMQQAFREVLVRASGKTEVLSSPVINKARADAYVKTFGFASDPSSNTPLLDVVFNQNTIEKLLRQAGYPVWGSNRPTVMVWTGVETMGRQLVTSNANKRLSVFQNALVKRGVPVVLPVGDLQDEMALPIPKLFGLFRQDVRTASERYSASAIVAVRVVQRGTQWELSGFLEHRGQSETLSFQGRGLDDTAAMLADRVASYFADRYGVSERGGAVGNQPLTISGVSDFAGYQQILQLLGSANGVDQVHVAAMAGDVMTLELSLHASWSQVRANLRLDRRLEPAATGHAFHWRGQ